MAEKELRRMSRAELIEIIYALQQNEQTLQKENERLKEELSDKKIRIENSGSIAEAALSLNKIFEDAQAAADQYLASVRQDGRGKEKRAAEEDPEKIKESSGNPEAVGDTKELKENTESAEPKEAPELWEVEI